MPTTALANPEGAILGRLVLSEESPLSRAAAEGILALTFSAGDKKRMHELAAKARAGELTASEQVEVEAYSRVGSLLGILHSKARRALKRRGVNGRTKSK